MRRVFVLVSTLAVASALLSFSAGPVFANHVHCGNVITQDTRLDSDLRCSGDGLSVAAANVTVDLAGHTIAGPGAEPFTPTGISAMGNSDSDLEGIRIRGGTVMGFGIGIRLARANAVVSRMRLTQNATGFSSFQLSTLQIQDTVASANLFEGLDIGKGTENGVTLRGIEASYNGRSGISVSYGNGRFLLTDSVATNNGGVGVSLFKVDQGLVADNRISANGSDGLDQTYCGAVLVIANVVANNARDGISRGLTGPQCEVRRNLIAGNAMNGVHQFNSYLIARDNRILGNGFNGVLLQNESYDRPPVANLETNTVSRNLADGIHIGADASGDGYSSQTLVQANTADRNGDDGIDIRNPFTSIIDNHAWRNGDIGIQAASGVTGSRNWAKHNGNPAQCVPGYLCSTKGKPKG